jgi:hypothetical protein
MLLAAIPVSAMIPMERLLTFVGIGAAGLVALFWGFVLAATGTPPDSRSRVAVKEVARRLGIGRVSVRRVLAAGSPPRSGSTGAVPGPCDCQGPPSPDTHDLSSHRRSGI